MVSNLICNSTRSWTSPSWGFSSRCQLCRWWAGMLEDRSGRTCCYKTSRIQNFLMKNLLPQNLLLNTSGKFHKHRQGILTWGQQGIFTSTIKEFSHAPIRNFHMHQQGIFTFTRLRIFQPTSSGSTYFGTIFLQLANMPASRLYLMHVQDWI